MKGSRKAPVHCRQLLQIKRSLKRGRARKSEKRKSNEKRTEFYNNTTYFQVSSCFSFAALNSDVSIHTQFAINMLSIHICKVWHFFLKTTKKSERYHSLSSWQLKEKNHSILGLLSLFLLASMPTKPPL